MLYRRLVHQCWIVLSAELSATVQNAKTRDFLPDYYHITLTVISLPAISLPTIIATIQSYILDFTPISAVVAGTPVIELTRENFQVVPSPSRPR